ncbi:SAP domain-containing protein [Trichoderma breve]|uniref:SAP domain-containing protein n=1 Tax=Trichoderma breve TaxID=2034170 RepID=A0A9W9E6H4_9HYPO|nr:SAP domain-containing protein [Trichoderma breve]KAJ4856461.1 SAP domain-containing protein [Trichoderma breve]
MADYTALKVPELKKLLAEKKLPQTGNKADLIARLQEDDKKNATASAPKADKPAESKEDEINYSDDEPSAASKPEKEQAAKPAEKPAAEPAAAAAAPTDKDEAKPAEESGDKGADEPAEAKEPAPSFAIGLSSTTADEELRKRVERAKRFGTELDDETKKLAERAKRFGVDDSELATGLDSALPERPLKRGRDRKEGDGNRPGKRRNQDRREQQPSGNERRSGRNKGNQNQGGKGSGKPKFSSIIEDPAEKAKAEKRAARFAAA